jgi:gentisate 1,2-dioxygenase
MTSSSWHEHHNDDASNPAFLFSFNDFPMINSLALFAETVYEDNGGHQELA